MFPHRARKYFLDNAITPRDDCKWRNVSNLIDVIWKLQKVHKTETEEWYMIYKITHNEFIMKTRLLKYAENFTMRKKMKNFR